MNDPSRGHYPVSSVGSLAHRLLDTGGPAIVDAVFDRSIYIRVGPFYVCCGVSSLGQGPLNVIAGIDEKTWRSLEYTRGMPAWVSSERIRIGGNGIFELKGARKWVPPAPPEPCLEKVEQGLHSLEATARNMAPEEGLGAYLCNGKGAGLDQGLVLRRAGLPLKSLESWLQVALNDTHGGVTPDAEQWKALIGLGPGLTPSGDDLIGGAMLALNGLGEVETAERLFASVKTDLSFRTNAISAAHLMAAVEGMGNESLHGVLNAVVSGTRSGYRCLLDGIGRIGHTSGWDSLAGITIVCRAWIMARRQKRPKSLPLKEAGIHI